LAAAGINLPQAPAGKLSFLVPKLLLGNAILSPSSAWAQLAIAPNQRYYGFYFATPQLGNRNPARLETIVIYGQITLLK
jgi:hypothetical protein